MNPPIDITNQRFGHLIVLSLSPERIYNRVTWSCRCDCGEMRLATGHDLRSHHITSCGRCSKHIEYGLAAMHSLILGYKAGARSRNLEYNLTEEMFRKITQSNCYYCGDPPFSSIKTKTSNGAYTFNGIDRIDNSKGYFISNVVSCCKVCNQAKSDRTQQDFLDWVKRVYGHRELTQ